MTEQNAWILLTAQICHEANRAIQLNTGDDNPSPKWADAPRHVKASAVDGVVKALNGATPEELHESWCDFKVKEGWKYGKEKDFEKLTHPCLVNYDQLPPEQKLKDHVFSSIVQTFKETAFI
jgi:RyR domain.